MLNNLTNFFNLIVGRRIKTQLEPSDLIAVGTKQSPALGDYKPTAIKFEDLQAQLGGGNTPSYKVYTALLTQTGTDAPIAAILENTLGGDVIWTRNDVGHYTATLIGAFPDENKFFTINTEKMIDPKTAIALEWLNSDSFNIYTNSVSVTFNGSIVYSGIDDVLYNYSVEIRVYP